MRRAKPDGLLVPNPVMDVVITAVCILLLIFSLKVTPTAAPPPLPPGDDFAALVQAQADADVAELVTAEQRKYADRVLALPPLRGWVALAVDISPSIVLDKLGPAEASVVAALVLNHKDITHLRAMAFGGDVLPVADGWVELDADNMLPAEKRAEVAGWLRAKLGAGEAAAAELSKTNRPLVLGELLARMGKPNPSTNLVGAIATAVEVAGGRAPATALVITDGVHTFTPPGEPPLDPSDIPAVRKRLDAVVAALPSRGDKPPPTVHAIALFGTPAWTGKRQAEAEEQPQAEAVVGLLRGLTARFGGCVLALPCEPSGWDRAEGLKELMDGKSPVPRLGGGKPQPGGPSAPATPSGSDRKYRFYDE